MTDPSFQLRDLIHDRTGLFFRDHQVPGFLFERLELLREKSGCGSLAEYHQLLCSDANAAAHEWQQVFTSLTKPASGFYRQQDPVRVLVEDIFPRLAARNGTNTLKIWSAACSTGEEPIAIAIALSEAGWFDRLAIEIHASDANPAAIEKARRGVYGERRVKALPAALRTKYFQAVGDERRVDRVLHERIRWSVANLAVESDLAELAASDIIVCRNVFIYFSEPAIERTVGLFGKYLAKGGYFITDGGDYFHSLMSRQANFKHQTGDPSWVWTKDKQVSSL